MKLNCEIGRIKNGGASTMCRVKSPAITQPSTTIKGIEGQHQPGKSNKDVIRVEFRVTVNFIPRGLKSFFPNLTQLSIYNCGLKSVTRNDLKEFKNLQCLWLGQNALTTLPDDLFEDTRKLTEITFSKNKISTMSSKLFSPIIKNKFECISFKQNVTIDAFYQPGSENSVASVAALLKIIDEQCSKASGRGKSSGTACQSFE